MKYCAGSALVAGISDPILKCIWQQHSRYCLWLLWIFVPSVLTSSIARTFITVVTGTVTPLNDRLNYKSKNLPSVFLKIQLRETHDCRNTDSILRVPGVSTHAGRRMAPSNLDGRTQFAISSPSDRAQKAIPSAMITRQQSDSECGNVLVYKRQ